LTSNSTEDYFGVCTETVQTNELGIRSAKYSDALGNVRMKIIVKVAVNYDKLPKKVGNIWENMQLNVPIYDFGIQRISMLNDTHGIMSTRKTLIVSHDGFETYDTIPLPINSNIADIYMVNKNSIYCILTDNFNMGDGTFDINFYKTSDEGKNWLLLPSPNYPYFKNRDMSFIDSSFGYVIGRRYAAIGDNEQDVIFRTTNGGQKWEKVLDTIIPWDAYGIEKISVLNKKDAIVLGQFGKIYWTHDGGDSWQLDSNAVILKDEPATLYPCILGTHTALIADFWARIFRSSLKGTDVEDDFENKNNIINDNWITINCTSEQTCSLRIEYYDLLGKSAFTYKRILQNTVNDLDISSLIEQKGFFVYRVYVNDLIVKNGKLIK
jgi:hypothetical protein